MGSSFFLFFSSSLFLLFLPFPFSFLSFYLFFKKMSDKEYDLTIIGGGIVGVSVGYFMSKKFGKKCLIIEREGDVAIGASGNAGGFLARKFCDEYPSKELARKSFEIHENWGMNEFKNEIDYRGNRGEKKNKVMKKERKETH